MSRDKKIDFTDSAGRILFTIRDGGFIQMSYGNGEEYTACCHYIDEDHIKIDSAEYPILEFARRMERNGISYVPAGM